MPPITGIVIEIDSAVKAFFPGQTITGRVLVDNEKPVETTGLKIKFEGKVKVNWPERFTRKQGGRNSPKFVTVFYTAEETYFQNEVFLLGAADPNRTGNNTIRIDRGRCAYEFQYTLPANLPSSFISRYGTVSYVIEATLFLPSNRSDASCLFPFTVNGILDLNVEAGANLSLESRKYKSICCFCCTTGPVGFIFKLPRRGFVPGEMLEFQIELSNQSNQRIYGMKVTLMQIAKLHAEGNSKVTMRPIRQVRGPEVAPGETEIWVEKMFKIPPVPPTRLASCKMIEVEYTLQLEMTLPKVSQNLKDEIPITIGTIPLRDTFANLSSSTMTLSSSSSSLKDADSVPSPSHFVAAEERTSGGGGVYAGRNLDSKLPRYTPRPRTRGLSVSSDHPSFLEYPDLPPPTYQEAIMLDKLDLTMENVGFAADEETASASRPGRSHHHENVTFGGNFVPQYVTYATKAVSRESDERNENMQV